MEIIPERPLVHPPSARRILYAGRNYPLLEFLNDKLRGYLFVRCPGGEDARLFLEHKLRYELLLFDKQLPDDTGRALARFARSQPFYDRTPIIVLSRIKARHVAAGVYFEKPDDARVVAKLILCLLQTDEK